MMSIQKICSIKISLFDKEHYNFWKMTMLLFVKIDNPIYAEILNNGSFIPHKEVPEIIVSIEIVLSHHLAKNPSKWIESEKEKVSLNGHLQLIIIDSTNLYMFGNISIYGSVKKMWNHIEVC